MSKKSISFFFKDGVGVYVGPVVKTRSHAHHATEIIVSLEGSIKVANGDIVKNGNKLVLIPHDVEHRFIGGDEVTPMFIYLDPFHHSSQQLAEHFELKSTILGLDHLNLQIDEKFLKWTEDESVDIQSSVNDLLAQLTGKPDIQQRADERILESIEYLKKSIHSNLKIKDIAASVHLSESRYAHLFKEHVGIPFRRFVLWTRLQTTVLSSIEGNSLTRACYEGGFSDLPHFSKTFMDMFGVSPSSVLKG